MSSVIINAYYNAERLIKECLFIFMCQIYSEIETLVIDNGFTEDKVFKVKLINTRKLYYYKTYKNRSFLNKNVFHKIGYKSKYVCVNNWLTI
jgi:hypothetical protein